MSFITPRPTNSSKDRQPLPRSRGTLARHPTALHPSLRHGSRVLDAYGWPDIPTGCEFLLDYEEDEDSDTEPSPTPKRKGKPEKKLYRYRWPDEVRDDVLARLLALNAERYEE